MAKSREDAFLELYDEGLVEYVRNTAEEFDEYSEGDDLENLADELQGVLDRIQDVMVDLDRSEKR